MRATLFTCIFARFCSAIRAQRREKVYLSWRLYRYLYRKSALYALIFICV